MTLPRVGLPQGTLDLLILKVLQLGPENGWAISIRMQQTSRDAFAVPQGSIYPALHRLERMGWIAATWRASDNNRRAKYYALTASGRRQLRAELATWAKIARALNTILDVT